MSPGKFAVTRITISSVHAKRERSLNLFNVMLFESANF